MWLFPDLARLIPPAPVARNRLLAPRFDFIFGMSYSSCFCAGGAVGACGACGASFVAGVGGGADGLLFMHRGGDDGHHRLPFHLRSRLHLRDVGDRLHDVLQDLEAALRGVGEFPSAEPDGHLALVAFLKEAADMLQLRVQVVLFRLRPDLDLLDLDDGLLLPRLLLPLARDVLELAEIHDPADRRRVHGGHFDQIEVLGPRALERLRRVHDTQLLHFGAHEPDFRYLDLFVDSGFLGDDVLLYSVRLTASPRRRSMNASIGMGVSCSPPRRRGETFCASASRSPTTSAYGTLFTWDSRILYPSFSFR